MRLRQIATFLIPGLIWGSEWLLTRGLDLPPLSALSIRYGTAMLVLAALMAMRGNRLPDLRLTALAATAGVAASALPILLVLWAGGRVSPGLLVVLMAMTPLIAALLEGRAEGARLMALVGGVGGTALLASQGLSFAAAQWAGAAAVLAAATLTAGSMVYIKRKMTCIPPLTLAAIQLAASLICISSAAAGMEGRAALAWSWKPAALEALLGVLGGALAWPLYYSLLREVESFQLTASQWVVTVVGIAESLALTGATPSWRIVTGAAVLLASLAALMWGRPEDEEPLTLQWPRPTSRI